MHLRALAVVALSASLAGATTSCGSAAEVQPRTYALHVEVHLPYGGDGFPSAETFDELGAVDDAVSSAVEDAGLGEWEGQSVGAGSYDVGLVGNDERALLEVVTRVVGRSRFARGTSIEVSRNDAPDTVLRTVRL